MGKSIYVEGEAVLSSSRKSRSLCEPHQGFYRQSSSGALNPLKICNKSYIRRRRSTSSSSSNIPPKKQSRPASHMPQFHRIINSFKERVHKSRRLLLIKASFSGASGKQRTPIQAEDGAPIRLGSNSITSQTSSLILTLLMAECDEGAWTLIDKTPSSPSLSSPSLSPPPSPSSSSLPLVHPRKTLQYVSKRRRGLIDILPTIQEAEDFGSDTPRLSDEKIRYTLDPYPYPPDRLSPHTVCPNQTLCEQCRSITGTCLSISHSLVSREVEHLQSPSLLAIPERDPQPYHPEPMFTAPGWDPSRLNGSRSKSSDLVDFPRGSSPIGFDIDTEDNEVDSTGRLELPWVNEESISTDSASLNTLRYGEKVNDDDDSESNWSSVQSGNDLDSASSSSPFEHEDNRRDRVMRIPFPCCSSSSQEGESEDVEEDVDCESEDGGFFTVQKIQLAQRICVRSDRSGLIPILKLKVPSLEG